MLQVQEPQQTLLSSQMIGCVFFEAKFKLSIQVDELCIIQIDSLDIVETN